jgi:hypothetical protein
MLGLSPHGSSPGSPATRTIRTAYRLGVRLRPREATKDAREQLARVAIEIESESDPALQQLFDEARAEIEQTK